MSIVEVQELRKQYDPPKGVLAVDGVSFGIEQGEIFSLLGPNGAGKSTTISMLSCLLRPSGGDATIAGHSVVSDSQAVKETIGVVPQDIALYPDMSARENLIFWGRMYGLSGDALKKRVDAVLELITLVDRQKDRVDKFSGGMKRRVNIGVALLHKPKVLYLDEPTVGIDPQSRRSILDGILALRDQGMTILYTTHYMAEAQELSDRIGIVDNGKMIALGTHEELVRIVGQDARVVARVDHYLEGMADRWREVPGVEKVEVEQDEAVLLVKDADQVLPRLFETAAAAGSRITEINVTEPNLEMVFLHLTGRALRVRPDVKVFAIAWKDLRSTVRNVPGLVMMLVAPLALASLLGFAFGGGDSFEIAATKVAVTVEDTGAPGAPTAAGCTVAAILESPDLKDVLEVARVKDAAAARKAVDDGDAAVAVVVPADFSRVVYGGDPAATSEVEIYENPTREVGGSIVEGVVGQVLADFNGARAAAAGAVALRSEGDPPAAQVAATAAEAFSRDGGISSALKITQRSPKVGKTESEVSVTGSVLSGMMVFFMFFGAANVARTILTEDRDGTMPRLFTTPTRHGTIIGGKFVSVFVTVLLQAVVLLIAGRLIFSIDWGRIDAVVLLTLVAAGVAGGLALLIISFAKTPAQAGAIGSGIYLVLALLGGNFTGTAQSSGAYAVVQKLTPNGWIIQGWDTAMRGGGAADIRWQVLVPLGFAVAFFFFAVLKMRRRFA